MSKDKRVSQMEENAHCPSPEKLSSLAFYFSMNSLYVRWGPGPSSWVQRDGAEPGRAVPGPSVSELDSRDRDLVRERGFPKLLDSK